MNELDLIKEVEKRPILYDKSVSGFNKTKLRDDAWKEVQEALNVSAESECKKRWRSLRDSFIKLQRTHGGKTRWPYHQHMRFLMPHVEPSLPKQLEDPPEVLEPLRRQSNTDDSDQDEDKIEVPVTYNQLPVTFAIDPRNITQLSEDDEDPEPPPKKLKTDTTEEEIVCSCNRTDPDELFLLSCASTLKRLNAKQNAVARLKIQKALFEAEFGGPGDLPYVTPASECGFDNIDPVDES